MADDYKDKWKAFKDSLDKKKEDTETKVKEKYRNLNKSM